VEITFSVRDDNPLGANPNGIAISIGGTTIHVTTHRVTFNLFDVILRTPKTSSEANPTMIIEYTGQNGSKKVDCKIYLGRPFILVAGYWQTNLSRQGGLLRLAAFCNSPDWININTVNILHRGADINLSLQEVTPGFYEIILPVNEDLNPLRILLELQAVGTYSGKSTVWPYLTVH
jgi:hypothetical protein